MKRITPIILLLAMSFYAVAQQSNDYTLLQCQDKIPASLIESSTAKYQKEIAELRELEQSKKERKLRSKFSLESHFVLDKLLQSGTVLFNDEVSTYLNKLAQKILANSSEELKKKVKIYTLRSSYVNAFATERGDIFVTLGLLARLQSESQLAFILSHEIAHVEEKHSIKSVLESAKINSKISNRNTARASVSDKRILQKSMYSKELELEADSLAVARYLGAGFDKNEIMGVFEVLKTSEQPFSSVKFDFKELESGSYTIQEKYKYFEVDSAKTIDENEDDEKSTHPNIGTRKEQVSRMLGVSAGWVRPSSNVEFEKIIHHAQMEIPMLYLHNGQPSRCVYTAQALLQQHPNNKYLKKCIAKALYIETKYQNDDDYKEAVLLDEVKGNIQQVYNLMEDMNDHETNALAMNYVWRQHTQWPEDEELKFMANDLTYEIVRHQKGLEAFIEIDTSSNNYWKQALIDFKDDKDLLAYFENAKKLDVAEKARKPIKKKKNKYLGVKKIVVVNPQYLQLDARKEDGERHITSEEGRYRIVDIVKLAAERSGLNCEILDVKKLQPEQIEAFNDLRFLNEWFSEQSDFNNLNITPGFNQDKINEIAKRYGTKYFLWTGVVSAQQYNYSWIAVPVSIFFPPALPFTTYAAIKPKYHMFYYSLLFNVENGTSEVLSYDYFKRKDSDALIKAHMYDSFYQIKRARKKRSK